MAEPFSSTFARSRIGGRLQFLASVGALSAAVWLYRGYIYPAYPQTGLLDWVYRFDGQYLNDFTTAHAPYHWALAHLLGWLPVSAISPALVVLWIAGLLVLWAGFVAIARTLGASLAGAVAAGLVAIPTLFWGFGVTPQLLHLTYPPAISFALAVAGLATLLHGRALLAGALLGLATLLHPDLGLLYTAAIAPALLVVSRQRWREAAIRFAVPWLLLAVPALVATASGQLTGSSLPAQEQLDMFTVIRAPHHYAYDYFPPSEYIQFAAWGAVLAVGLVVLRRSARVRAVALVAGSSLVICAAGALASAIGQPLALIAAQTARLSSLVVLLGTVMAGVLLTRGEGPRRFWGAVALVAVFMLAPLVAGLVEFPLRDFDNHRLSIVEACLVLIVIGASALLPRVHVPSRVGALSPRLAGAALAIAFTIASVSLIASRAGRAIERPTSDAAFIDVSERARESSSPGDVFLTPPDQDGFRTFARRGTVVEFGTIEWGSGEAGWKQRLIDATGNPSVLDASLGTDVDARVKLIADSYDRTVASSRLPICRYAVTGVVARSDVPPPRWLRLVYRNRYYELMRVRPRTCPA